MMLMGYTAVDLSTWGRREHFEAFQTIAKCTFSLTAQLDITTLVKQVKSRGWKFYPTMIHLIAQALNKYPEFRMRMKEGVLVTWDVIHPSYTIFHEESETFSSLWCHHKESRDLFFKEYEENMALYGDSLAYSPMQESTENIFYVSANPWVSFTSFEFNLASFENFFAPMLTIGKYYEQGNRILMPLAVQVHHAVCDGFHVGRMINELQELCAEQV
ncbi:type A chloramphenicol O-acetyltransferase [Alcaligenes endophyticus]|uniref:Chloramphenicol acetyltransferase n=1 Tax=Alcaligenes endophyticus TaxID=1929088 RepID=A0ABT8EIV5_9BURK|nr:type A chloramphenicol O-acetyltransferase [Alcaligenes endophyticus]MCX5592501.1 type A chloramphenicol O-acetyltransferase [Alcaligenes endophyticus]MDN4121226.1 type A chloramphenicol O-acetyltransferase [Alcaligenes endophyticus]